MNTKHTSKTLQERLKRLELLRTFQRDLEAFHTNPGRNEITPVALEAFHPGSYAHGTNHRLILSTQLIVDVARAQWGNNQMEIEQILEELGLEE